MATVEEPNKLEVFADLATTGCLEVGAVYLKFAPETPYETWMAVVEHLKARLREAGQRLPWLIGDAINYGENAYGERYSAVLEETDYDYGSLRVMAWTARRFAPEARRLDLPFSHFTSAARLAGEAPKAAAAILANAVKFGHTRAEVRAQARAAERRVQDGRRSAPEARLAAPRMVRANHCPTCTCLMAALPATAPISDGS